ncbi:hypothetical protein EVU96_09310 [Bacillus infantis]|uniref:hypothetical protein n=1 Tax=Bacillus infantis TaxID=324767 RepID=UPI00101E0037|nr:hypothetical protein [Bacillus infantis]RYI30603.1 hypothetical protein EVU96_09310 [Bacillus infantis]
MEKFLLSSTPIEISEFANHKEATFLISVLDEYNLNDVLIEKDEGEKYHSSIIGYPILAYLKYDKDGKPNDFGGHELRAKYNADTKEIDYYFATFPIGSVTESWIEEREVDGYEGLKNVIMIKTKLWKSRFPEYFKVFDKLWEDGNISSSWEISSSETKKTKKGKVLKVFEFIGNCLLGSNVQGAVKGAGVLEVASNDEMNFDLSNALLHDIHNTDSAEQVDENNPDEGGNEEMPKNKENELSAMTDNDIYTKVRKAINASNEDKWFYVAALYPYDYKAIAYTWDRSSDEDYVQFNYTVNSDETISITSQEEVKMTFVKKEEVATQISELEDKLSSAEKDIAEAGKSITELSKEKEALETQVSELAKYKEKVEELEKAELEKQLAEKKEELKAFALEDELIASEELESDETLSTIISELTLENYDLSQEKIEVIKGRKAIAKFKESKVTSQEENTVEVSESTLSAKGKTDLNNAGEDGILTAKDVVMSAWLKK